ncbi:MAG: type II toxin-antitoxin system RelE/ParE family toxin [Pirellulaceae bacterium]|nr:type II toxin-antitoxin system RelE/ParE family toxin [Pirellulaceae bacterium]
MAKKATGRPAIHLTDRALRDIASIEAYSIEQFGKRVASKYIDKLESGINYIAENPSLLREETPFHRSLRFYRVEKHLLVCETAIDTRVIILTVLHASMDVPSRLAELEPSLKAEVEMLAKWLRDAQK